MSTQKPSEQIEAIQVSTPDGNNHTVGIWNLHVLIVPDGKGWFAQAFEIDYGVQGNSLDEVKKRFEDGLATTIHHNIDIFGSIDNLLCVYPEWWILKGATKGSEYEYSCISMHKVAPKAVGLLPFKGIEYEAVRPASA